MIDYDNDDDDDGSLLTPMFKHKLNVDLVPEPPSSSPAVHLKQMTINNKPKLGRKPKANRKPTLRENLVKEYFKNSPLLAIQNSKVLTEKADSEYFEFRIKVERGIRHFLSTELRIIKILVFFYRIQQNVKRFKYSPRQIHD